MPSTTQWIRLPGSSPTLPSLPSVIDPAFSVILALRTPKATRAMSGLA